MPKKDMSGVIELQRLETQNVQIGIVGLTPLMPHKWSEKALLMMPGNPDAEMARMRKKGVRNPVEEAEACVYRMVDGQPALPATAFKAAMVSACRHFEKPTMVEAKQLFFVHGEMVGTDQLVRFFYSGEPELRRDMPRNANGGTDLRYRYAFYPWWAYLTIQFIPASISATSIATLLDAAGRGGVGDWRPSSPKSSTGTFGMFRVMEEGEEVQYGS